MKKIATLIYTLSISTYALLHFLSTIFPLDELLTLLSLTGLITLLFGIGIKVKTMGVPLFLLSSSVSIHFIAGLPIIDGMMEGILQMRGLIALLLIVPVISWILKEEPYIQEIMNFAHNLLNTSKKFYFGLMAITQLIAYFLLFGAIPMVYQFINSFLSDQKGEAWEYFKGTALLRAFSLTTLWVISIPSFVFAVDHLGASLTLSILQGFVISLCGIGIAVVFSHYQEKRYGVDITSGIQKEIEKAIHKSTRANAGNKRVIEFMSLFLSLFGSIFFLHIFLGWELLMIIPPIILLWTLMYFLIKRRGTRLINYNKQYVTKEIGDKPQQFSLLLSAGLLIYSFNQSGLGKYIVDGMFYITDVVPFLNFLFILPFVVILLGFLGLGPLTVIVLVAGIIENVSLPYPPELVVLSITSGSVISILLSPFILPVIVLSGSNGLGVFKNGLQFNIGYTIVFFSLVQVYLQVMLKFI